MSTYFIGTQSKPHAHICKRSFGNSQRKQ